MPEETSEAPDLYASVIGLILDDDNIDDDFDRFDSWWLLMMIIIDDGGDDNANIAHDHDDSAVCPCDCR